MTLRCPACETELPDDVVYCSKCGQRLTGEPVSERPQDKLRNPASRNDADDPENELWQGGFSPKSMIGAWFGAGGGSLVVLVAAIGLSFTGLAWVVALVIIGLTWGCLAAVFAYRRIGVHYTLTTQRFIHERGILSRQTDRIEVIDVDDVTFRQGPIERLLGVGTIEIVSTDRTDPTLVLKGIDDVKRVAGLIDDARRVERRKRGLHIEQT